MQQARTRAPSRADAGDASSVAFRRWVGRLRMRHLELLALLGSDPNIGRAAVRMHLTQPTVSKLLIDIESICEAPLFTRNRRGLEPNAAGAALCARAVLMLQALRATRDELAVALKGAARRARIGVFPVAVPGLLAGMRQHLCETSADMVLAVEEGLEHQLIEALAAGRLDCVLGRVVLERLPRGILHEALSDEPTVIVSGPRHPLARARKAARAALLAQSDWLLPAQEGAIYNLVTSRLALDRLPAPRVVVESSSVLVVVELLEHFHLLSVLARNVARPYERAGRLAVLPIELMPHHYPLGIMYRQESAGDPLVALLLAAARAAAAIG